MVIPSDTGAKLLDFTQRFDIDLLDRVVSVVYSETGEQQKLAQEILTTLTNHPDSWTRVDTILEFSNNKETKYFGLQILEQVIKTRWKAIPRAQCDGIKKFIVALIIKTSSAPGALQGEEKVYINKLNVVLVQILKREWPKNWSTFIPDIVGASKTNESLCQNNMTILKLLSEEVFDFSAGQMVQAKVEKLKDTMHTEFAEIFNLCQFVMENTTCPRLILATLETLLRFLNWIPLEYVFETELIAVLTGKFLSAPPFRNATLKCLTEIAPLTTPFTKYYPTQFLQLFSQTLSQLEVMVPLSIDLRDAFSHGSDDEQKFIQNLAMFLSTFLKKHEVLVGRNAPDLLFKGLQYLVQISEVEDVEILKICLEYWNDLAYNLQSEIFLYSQSNRNIFYGPLLSMVRLILITRMVQPEEILVVENENGEVVREFMRDTDSINLYRNMRETLVSLTHLDCHDTVKIMTEKLKNQVNGSEWSCTNLNTLCWAIGSISGAMGDDDELPFILNVMEDLFVLSSKKKKVKDEKGVVTFKVSFMYLVGQYPQFLRAHSGFLIIFVRLLFDNMHLTQEGVQDMACDTLLKIARECSLLFVTVQIGEERPFIEEILERLLTIISDLTPGQVHTFYEAVGHMISVETDNLVRDGLIERLMGLPNTAWDAIISQAVRNVEILKEIDCVHQLGCILKTNVRAAKSLGHVYVGQLGRIYLDMLNVYRVTSSNITSAIATHGEPVTKQPLIKGMRVVKKETLKLISTWITRSKNPEMVLDHFIPGLFDAVLLDYQVCSVPAAREPEALTIMAAIVNKLEASITPQVPKIFDAVFECTLAMITKDFQEFPEHRVGFFEMVQAVTTHCFSAYLTIPPAQFKLVLDSIIWAVKHTMRTVADIGLEILYTLLQKISIQSAEVSQSFHETYFLDILEHVLSVVTDSSHVGALAMHATILAYLFSIVEMGLVQLPGAQAGGDGVMALVLNHVVDLLKRAFPHLTENQVKVTVLGMVSLNQDVPRFRDHLADFLVQIKEITGDDESDLYLEEREATLQKIEAEKGPFYMAENGSLNPEEEDIPN